MLEIQKISKLLLLAVLAVSSRVGHCQHSPSEQVIQGWLQVVDTILDHHLDPPTRQQMVLCGAKKLYRVESATVPTNLSKRISSLSTNEEMLQFLAGISREFSEVDEATLRMQFLEGVSECVPGGISILPAEEARVEDQLAANRYVGIGIALTMTEGVPEISKVFYDGPGYKVGVHSGDKILEINGLPTDRKDLGFVVKELRGEEGTDVRLLLQQEEQDPREITITRGVTFIPTIEGTKELSPGEWTYLADSHPDIAVLHIRRIGPSTVHELTKIEAQLRSHNLKGIVIDLRQAGGPLHDIVMLADKLLDEGTIGTMQSKEKKVTHKSLPGCLFKDIPMVVLIAEYSGPGEIYLTAALQDLGRAEVVGQPTKSKAFVRSRIGIPSGDRLVLATGILRRGDGTVLSRSALEPIDARPYIKQPIKSPIKKPGFIMPDHVIDAQSAGELATGDAWLRKAFEVLGNSRTSQQEDKG